MSALRLGSQFRRAERGRAGSEGTASPEESGGFRAVDSAAPAAGADLYAPDSVCGVGGSEGTPAARGAPGWVRLRRSVWALALGARRGRTDSRGARAGGAGARLSETKASGMRFFLGRSPGSQPCAPEQGAEPRAPQLCTGTGGDRVMARWGQGFGTPSGPAPKLGAGMTKYGVCARLRGAGRNPVIL